MITPTLDYYQLMVEDETCLVLRKYKDQIHRFVRVTFVNETFVSGFYQQQLDGGRSLLLGFIHSLIKNGLLLYPASASDGLTFNAGCVLRFISYSNSQIKRHSCWFFVGPENVKEYPMTLNEDQIIESMGDFSREKNILKRYARRGQCFSTAKYIMTLTP